MAEAGMTTFSSVSQGAVNVYIARQMYRLAERNLVLNAMAKAYQLAQRNSKTIRVIRYDRATLPNRPLDEGVPPALTPQTLREVDATVEQWGIVMMLTDIVQLTVFHPILEIASSRTALAISEVMEREMGEVCLTGQQVLFGGTGNTARDDLGAADVMTSALCIGASAQLRAKGAAGFSQGLFEGAMPPQVEADVLLEAGAGAFVFSALTAHTTREPLVQGRLGIWAGVDWRRGNFLPYFVGVPAPTAAAATAEKAQFTAQTTGGTLAAGAYRLKVVAREVATDYERKISVQSANITTTGSTGSIDVGTPTSTNYSYDLYLTELGQTAPEYLVAEHIPAATTHTITGPPSTSALVAPPNPASGVAVFPSFVLGQDAVGRVELNGMSLQTYITPPGASFSNPLAQGRKVGAKIAMKHFVIQDDFFMRVETSSSISPFLPA